MTSQYDDMLMTIASQPSPSQYHTRIVDDKKSSRLDRWFAKRAPRQDSATLSLRNVYIFFSREGALFALLLIITFIAGINYANNLVLGLCFYLASVWVISFHLTFAHVIGLKIQLLEVTVAEAGSPAWVTLKVTSTSAKPRRQLSFTFEQQLANSNQAKESGWAEESSQAAVHEGGASSSIPAYAYSHILPSISGEHIIKLPVMTQQRGRMILPRLKISSVYPLGIMRAWSYVYFATPAWVTPKPWAFDWQAQYIVASDEAAVQSHHVIQGQHDFDRLDDYTPGQSLARVSWPHVARGQGMLTKHFADPVGQELRLDYADMPAAHHEQKLSQLAYALQKMPTNGAAFQVILPNDLAEGVGGAGRIGQGEAFVQASMLRLAKVR